MSLFRAAILAAKVAALLGAIGLTLGAPITGLTVVSTDTVSRPSPATMTTDGHDWIG